MQAIPHTEQTAAHTVLCQYHSKLEDMHVLEDKIGTQRLTTVMQWEGDGSSTLERSVTNFIGVYMVYIIRGGAQPTLFHSRPLRYLLFI